VTVSKVENSSLVIIELDGTFRLNLTPTLGADRELALN
jgi:hypothetical protein